MSKKKSKTMIQRLREIRDKISLETMDMTFEELQEYYAKRKKRAKARRKYKPSHTASMAAEPRAVYTPARRSKK